MGTLAAMRAGVWTSQTIQAHPYTRTRLLGNAPPLDVLKPLLELIRELALILRVEVFDVMQECL